MNESWKIEKEVDKKEVEEEDEVGGEEEEEDEEEGEEEQGEEEEEEQEKGSSGGKQLSMKDKHEMPLKVNSPFSPAIFRIFFPLYPFSSSSSFFSLSSSSYLCPSSLLLIPHRFSILSSVP